MNKNHARLCSSPEWAQMLQTEVLPAVCDGVELGPRLLEIGPGPGAATDWLRHRTDTLVAVEIDETAAASLRTRYSDDNADDNVEIITGDASQLPFPDGSFDAAASFTMLHHVPSRRQQNRIFTEVVRVLRPGGTFVASDSSPGTAVHDFHVDDTYNPVDAATLIARLQTVGFATMTVEVNEYGWTVRARTPAEDDDR